MSVAHDSLLPRPPGGLAPGAALALLVHAGLIAALTVSVDWRTQAPEVVSAELWASVPQRAAPQPAEPTPAPPPPVEARPVAPPPAPAAPAPPPVARPPEPDIALERRKIEQAQKRAKAEAEAEADKLRLEKVERAERAERAERTKAEKARVDKARADNAKADKAAAEKEAAAAKADEARLAKQREDNLKRIMGQAGNATGRNGTAAQEAGPSASYAGAVAARIRRELVFPGDVPETAEAEVLVRAASSGTIVARQLTKSSGYKDWDDAVLRAIDKTGTLPRDTDGRVQTAMTLVFKRKE